MPLLKLALTTNPSWSKLVLGIYIPLAFHQNRMLGLDDLLINAMLGQYLEVGDFSGIDGEKYRHIRIKGHHWSKKVLLSSLFTFKHQYQLRHGWSEERRQFSTFVTIYIKGEFVLFICVVFGPKTFDKTNFLSMYSFIHIFLFFLTQGSYISSDPA